MTLQLNNKQMAAARALMGNRSPFTDSVGSIYLGGTFGVSSTAKHDLYVDFGYPRPEELTFHFYYWMYRRNGLAKALVERTTNKTWQDMPVLRIGDKAKLETPKEREMRRGLEKKRFWQALRDADRRSMVGKYSAVILQLNDGAPYNQPVQGGFSSLDDLISIIPAWEQQLEPNEWDSDKTSPTYGQPLMYRFNETSVDPEQGKVRSFAVHPDRVLIWSEDGTTFGNSKLEACYNALTDSEKIRGAGGEGFWKNAKAQPILQANDDVDFNQLATMLGVELSGVADALDKVVEKWSRGFDQSLMLQNMEAKNLDVSLPDPMEFFNITTQEIAASWPMPQKVLIGMQTGERASTEDAREWAQTNMSRRANIVIPNIMELIERFKAWGIVTNDDWQVDWSDLTAPTLAEKLSIGEKMAKVNKAMAESGGPVFTQNDIREVTGYDPTFDDTDPTGGAPDAQIPDE